MWRRWKLDGLEHSCGRRACNAIDAQHAVAGANVTAPSRRDNTPFIEPIAVSQRRLGVHDDTGPVESNAAYAVSER